MKKKIIILQLLLLLGIFTQTKAQLNIKATKEQAEEQLNRLKATTTVFFYKKSKNFSIDSIKQAISSVWDLTPIIFEDINKAEKYMSNPKFSFFDIEGYVHTTSSQAISYSSVHYYLVLRVYKEEDKKGRTINTPLCRIELFPSYETIKLGTPHVFSNGYIDPDEVISNLYEKGVFYNWSAVLFKAQFAALSTELKNNERTWIYKNIKETNLPELLSKDTLYIPDYLLVSYNAFSGKEDKQDENIVSGYKYNYKICSEKELYQIFEVEKRGKFLLEYVKSSSDKFITIYDLQNKKIIYKRYTPMSYNIKKKDFEAIE